MPTYRAVRDALHSRFETVGGLASVLTYAPTSVHAYPLLYSELLEFTKTRSGQMTVRRFVVQSRIVVPVGDDAGVEDLLVPFLESIPASVDDDPFLGGLLAHGYAGVVGGIGEYVDIGGTICRSYTFRTEIFWKE